MQQAVPISHLIDRARRLREVRAAQRRFMRLWANERADWWLRQLRPDLGPATTASLDAQAAAPRSRVTDFLDD